LRQSGNGFSWGTGLVAFADPSSLPAATQDRSTWAAATTSASDVIFWPQINTTYPSADGSTKYVYNYSTFPVPADIGLKRNWLFGGIGLTYPGDRPTRSESKTSGRFQDVDGNKVTLQAGTPKSGLDSIIPGYYLILGSVDVKSGYPPTGEMRKVLSVDTSNPKAIVCTLDAPFVTRGVGAGTAYTPYNPNTVLTTFVTSNLNWQQVDQNSPGLWVETAHKHGFIQPLSMFLDYGTYANWNTYSDPTPNGLIYHADIASRIYPGQKLINYGTIGSHGGFGEAFSTQLAISDPAAIQLIADKIAAGTVTPADEQLAPASLSNVTTLGGTFQTTKDGRGNRGMISFTGGYFDPISQNVYLLSPGSALDRSGNPEPSVDVWHINS
jgi:hypothetical protein